ncbi:hypothetical protein JVU11DRAFT_3446 [Chiua virens]|nr:hypothetical protein JVU11DRAFT_3446 [Chiua virens]
MSAHMASFNLDLFILIIEHLDVDDLIRLASTCRLLHHIVHHFGWSTFLRNNPRRSLTLHSSLSRWSPFEQVRYNTLADRAWSHANFVARPLSRPWHGYLQPAIALSVSTLVVAAGRTLYSYVVQDTPNASPSRIVFERSYNLVRGNATVQPDITSVAFLPDVDQHRTVFLGFEDGFVDQVCLPHRDPHNRQQMDIPRSDQSVLQSHGSFVVQSMSCSSHTLLSLSQWGSVSFTNLASAFPSSTSLNLGTRSWSSHLCMTSSSPYAVFGTTSSTPLSLYHISPHGFSSTPSFILHSPKSRQSAVYSITSAPPSSPLGPSEQIIVSGWYDGSVHIYDLRVRANSPPLPSSTSSIPSPPAHLPILTLRDRWSPEPIYSISCGGGNASFVAAGMARHSVVAFWDVRHPSRSWSVHAPGNDSSPVYSIVLESSRLFGATQSRPFVYDFGPGVTRETYPPIPTSSNAGRRGITDERLKLERNGIGYHVAKYSHCRTNIS